MMTKDVAEQALESLLDTGFDRSRMVDDNDPDGDEGDREYSVRVSCSRCEALVIQGVACHETGCPNRQRSRED